jgi:Fe2+ or Zn2+ uptake regulation protein
MINRPATKESNYYFQHKNSNVVNMSFIICNSLGKIDTAQIGKRKQLEEENHPFRERYHIISISLFMKFMVRSVG